MDEIYKYDEAAHKFYSSLSIKSLPLISWDIYGPYFGTICSYFNDVVSLLDLAKTNRWAYRNDFNEILFGQNKVIVITDTNLSIVHATQNIIAMNGYRPTEILGKKPKLFQGPKTCSETNKRIRIAVANRLPFEETVINYRKNGSTYNCWIRGEPIFDTTGELVNFIAYEKEVA